MRLCRELDLWLALAGVQAGTSCALTTTLQLLLPHCPCCCHPCPRFELGDDAPYISNVRAVNGTDPAVPDIHLEADVTWVTDK